MGNHTEDHDSRFDTGKLKQKAAERKQGCMRRPSRKLLCAATKWRRATSSSSSA